MNRNNQDLYHPSFKSLVSEKKIIFPALAHSAEQISNLNNSANSQHNSKKYVNENWAQMGSIDEQSQRSKILRYCPFKKCQVVTNHPP
jgi:flagellar biosynthesis/type III secretory pathway chaperone